MLTSTLILVLFASLVTYRVTRFVLEDTLFEDLHWKLHKKMFGTTNKMVIAEVVSARPWWWRSKLYQLLTCPYCVSVHVAWVLTIVLDHYRSIELPVLFWLAVCAGAMVIWRRAEP